MTFRGPLIVPMLLSEPDRRTDLRTNRSRGGGMRPCLQEVIVTARKREERLQDVPLTITAITSDTIAAAGISNVAQLSSMTPGFHYEKEGSRQISQPRIRGMEINTANPTRQNASFFIDGVYMPGSIQSLDFNEFERVEVIKGPQSALFGRQTFGGAVNFVSKVPRNEAGGRRRPRRWGHMNSAGLSGSLAGALVDDKLFGRRAYSQLYYGGKVRNAIDGARLGKEKSLSGSAVLTWMPTDDLRFDLRYTRTGGRRQSYSVRHGRSRGPQLRSLLSPAAFGSTAVPFPRQVSRR